MSFDSLVFDLDGTLWDTTHACAVAWNEVLAARSIPYRTITAEDVRLVTGKPHDDCIRLTFADLPEKVIEKLIEDTAIADNEAIARLGGTLYEGVLEGLSCLRNRYPLFIVSNCQAGYIENFLELTGLTGTFLDFECFGNTGRSKGDNLAAVMARNNLVSPIMIGDAEGDEAAARRCSVHFAFVEYGFGRVIAPDFRFDSFPSLVQHFLD